MVALGESLYAATEACCHASTQGPCKHKVWDSKSNLMDRVEALTYHSSLSIAYSQYDGYVHHTLLFDRCLNHTNHMVT